MQKPAKKKRQDVGASKSTSRGKLDPKLSLLFLSCRQVHRGQTSNKNKLRRQTSSLHRVLNKSNFFGKRPKKW